MAPMKRLMVLLPPLLLAFLSGVFMASLDTPPEWFVISLVLVAGALLVGMFFSKHAKIPLLLFCCLGLICGIERYAVWNLSEADAVLLSVVGNASHYSGIVIDEPDVREGKTHLTVELRTEGESPSRAVAARVLVIVNRFPEYHYGDQIALDGKLVFPKVLTEKDGRVFDYPQYLRTKGIRFQMIFPKITIMMSGQGNAVMSKLFAIKSGFEQAIAQALPSPQSALLSGLLLGGKQSLGAVWLERFQVAGIVHIIVLSGYNMTIVAEWLVVMFRSFGFYGSLSAGSVGIILFALMTGGGATVLRAAIMALIVLLAKATGRNYDMGRALLLAAALMVMQNPSILLFDPSFQLSFLASLGLIYVSPIVERRTKLFHSMPMLREVFVSTVATQVVVLPLLLYQTGMFSLVSLPANLLVLPLIPLTMFSGFIAGLIALASPTAAIFVGLPAYGFLSWILSVAEYAGEIPYAALHVGNIPAVAVFGLYALLALVIYYEQFLHKIIFEQKK